MNKEVLKIARKKLKLLLKKYDGFINIIVDDWRGYRFVFDTKDVKKCNNKCASCKLYQLLKNQKKDFFSTDLVFANKNDKKIFGKQNFLNCKTLEQYSQCYLNFINKINNKEELIKELRLVSNFKIIYSRDYKIGELEKKFKNFIFNQAIKQADFSKKKIIKKYFKLYFHEIRQ